MKIQRSTERCPGGWLYMTVGFSANGNHPKVMSTCFVPDPAFRSTKECSEAECFAPSREPMGGPCEEHQPEESGDRPR